MGLGETEEVDEPLLRSSGDWDVGRVAEDPERLSALNCLALTRAWAEDVAIAAEVNTGAALEERLGVVVAAGPAFFILAGIATGQKLHTRRP